jgi:hypothetical protein
MTLTNEDVFDLVVCFTGIILLFKRVAVMDRYQPLRVFWFSVIFSGFLIYCFCVFVSMVEPTLDDCMHCLNQY